MKWLISASILLMSALLMGTAIDKIVHWPEFLQALQSYTFLPAQSRHVVAGGVLATELFASVALLLRNVRRYALLLAASLFGLFALLIWYLSLTASDAPCGCTFSLGSGKVDPIHIVLNLVLAALSVLLVSLGTTAAAEHPPQSEEESSPPGHHI